MSLNRCSEVLEDRTLLAVFLVNSIADGAPAVDGNLTLREALNAANTNAASGDAAAGDADGDVILFDSAVFGGAGATITLAAAQGDLLIADDVLIDGATGNGGGATAVTVDGGGVGGSRIFYIDTSGATGLIAVTLTSLTLQNGDGTGNVAGVDGLGGAIHITSGENVLLVSATITNNSATRGGGGIFSSGTATIQGGSMISGNSAGSEGGGIKNASGTLIVDASTISNNTAGVFGGGIDADGGSTTIRSGSLITGNSAAFNGGGIDSFIGTLLVDASTISNNTAQVGGGIFNNGGAMTITGSTLSGNSAFQAGGIFNSGTLTVTGSTLSGNSAVNLGGAIVNSTNDTIDITNSTLSSNSSGGSAGGIFNDGTLTITGSTLTGNSAAGGGGAISNQANVNITNSTLSANSVAIIGGAIQNVSGALTITDSTLSGNSADDDGGGIANFGALTITNSTLSGNSAGDDGGGIVNFMGRTLTITNSTLSGNSAGDDGGGILNDGGVVTITASTLSGNTASSGGGIHNADVGRLTIIGSTLSNNSAFNGGGICNANSAMLTITNSTLSGNSADNVGGGIHNVGVAATVTLRSSTIADNSAANIGGGIYNSGNTVTADNTIIATNQAPSGPDFSGDLTSNNFNLIGSTSGITFVGGIKPNDQVNKNPRLGTLQDNGGPTFTHALLPGSPAIDKGFSLFLTDQRGFARSVGLAEDIGAFEVQAGEAGQAGFGGDEGDNVIIVRRNAGDPSILEVEVDGNVIFSQPIASVVILPIFGFGGNDTLIVDNTNGLIDIPQGIEFDGGLGRDSLQLIGTTMVDSSTYSVGPTNDAGTITHVSGMSTQTIDFTGLEPVIDTVAAATLTVSATNADNAINYTQGSVAANGLVSVDGFETMEFSNKTNLVINGLAGSDTINLNNPTTPTGLTGITVNGGDPTGSDRLIFNSAAGLMQQLVVTPTGEGAGTLTGTNYLPVAFNGIEELTGIAQAADADGISYADTPGDDTFQLTPGETPDAGRITGFSTGANPFSFVPLDFHGFLGFVVAAFDVGGGGDTLVIDGTSGDDVITFETLPAFGGMLPAIVVNDRPPIFFGTDRVGSVVLRGLEGNDEFNVNFPLGTTSPFIGSITIEGGDPSGSDILNLNTPTGVASTVTISPSLADPTRQSVMGLGAFLELAGLEHIRLTGSDLDDELLVFPGGGNDVARLDRPNDLTGDWGRVLTDSLPEIAFSGLGNFRLDQILGADTTIVALSTLGGSANYQLASDARDTVIIEGTALDDTTTITRPASGSFSVTQGGEIITELFGLPTLEVRSANGDDVLTVDNSNGLILSPIVLHGGSGADSLVLTGSTAVDAATYSVGPNPDQGSIIHTLGGTTQSVTFTGLEPVIDLVASNTLTVNGTNADNAINYTQGSVAVNGLVSVDGFETIEFSNKTNLVINGLAGSDTINLNNPTTPTGLTSITINGGDPTADTDTVIVNGVVGVLDVWTVNPTAQGAGNLVSNILAVVNYQSVEAISIVQQAGDGDAARVNGTLGDDVFEHQPGLAAGRGAFSGRMDTGGDTPSGPFDLPAITYSGVALEFGAGVGLNFGGASGGSDTFVAHGTDENDVFTVSDQIVVITRNGQEFSRVGFEGVDTNTELIVVEGGNGDDVFNVTPTSFASFDIRGGNSSTASDVLNFTGTGGAVTLDLAAQTITEAGLDPVSYSGIEQVNLNAGAAAVTLTGTAGDDDISATPNGANSAVVTRAGDNTLFSLTNTASLTVDGLGGSDDLRVDGSAAGEMISVSTMAVTVGAFLTVSHSNFEALEVFGQQGADTFNVTPGGIAIFINGGNPIGTLQQPVGDILNVITGGSAFQFLPGPESDSGTFAVAGTQPISFDEIERLQVNGVNYILPDRFDNPEVNFPGNNSIATATVLGSHPQYVETNLTLHDTGAGINDDFFKITANQTGKLIINAFFVDAAGGIDIQVLDMSGDLVASSTSTTDNEQIIIPVVSQQMYFLRVFSFDGVPNIYSLEIENFAAPVPISVDLDPASDTGMMNNDNITGDATPRFIILADLQDFADMGITILTSAQAEFNLANPNNVIPGAAVELHIISTTTGLVAGAPVGGLNISGFADPIGTSTILFEFTPDNPLPVDVYIVAAAVRIFDGKTPSVNNRTQLSDSILVTIDDSAPKGMVLPSFSASASANNAGVRASFRLNPASTELFATVELAGADLNGLQTPAFTGDNVVRVDITNNANTPVFNLLANALANNTLDAVSSRLGALLQNPALAGLLPGLLSGMLNLEVELMDGTIITADILSSGGAIQMLQSSDSGMSIIDNVTNEESPAFIVKGEANAKFRIFARNINTGQVNLIGSGVIGGDGSDGVPNNGFGIGEITVAPLTDGTYDIFAEFEDFAGNVSRHYDFTPAVLPQPLTDNGQTQVAVNVAGLFGNISDLDLQLSLTHANLSELSFMLTSPQGTVSPLINFNDLTGANLVGTVLDDEALLAITAGTARYSGRFRPSAALLSVFDGQNPNGTWTLTIIDNAAGNAGTLQDFHLCVQTNGGLRIEIDTEAPNTAFLDLAEASDTGRNNDDNVTRDNTPDVTITTEDPNSQFHQLFTDNLKFRIYDRLEGGQEFLLYDSARDGAVDAISTSGDNFTSLQFILETLPAQFAALIGTNSAVLAGGVLADGIHNFKLEVEDRAGNISHDFLSNVLIDTAAPAPPPTVIDPAFTDTGVPSTPATFSDRITSHTSTPFTGSAEANSIVRLFANGVFLGLTVAVPLDGDEAFPNGSWRITPQIDLNDSGFFPRDGIRRITATAEDLAGNVSEVFNLDIFIDTQGPRIFDPDGIGPRQSIEVGGAPGFNIMAPILGQGPTPPVTSLIINIEDLPARVVEFLYDALDSGVASNVGNYQLVGDHSGIISIDQIIVTNLPSIAGQPARATIELKFNTPLPDDRYSLTIFDTLVDPAGNALDGESNGSSPTGVLLVRSGDGNPGGSFFKRFTVDSRPEIASVGQSVVLVDINGNLVLDLNAGDTVNRDTAFNFGLPTDAVFAGQFTPPGVPSDGFDRIGAYGFVNGAFRWLLDFTNDGIPDYSANSIFQINGLPFAGEFTALRAGDEVGLFDGTTWYIDITGDNNIGPGDLIFTGNMRGLPITGDFDGDGLTDLATHLASTNTFFFDLTSAQDGTPGVLDGNTDATINFGFGGVLERPFAGDFNLDGVTDIGLTVPNQNDLNAEVSDWYIILSNPAAHVPGTLNALFQGFYPVPGQDVFTQFGSNDAVPLVGNFRPPAPQFANTVPGAGVVGADAGGGPHVRVFDNATGEERLSFFAYSPNFLGGVRVASGDINGDGVADVITGPGAGGGPHVKVFNGVDGSELMSFFAFDPRFTGGVTVASGDVNMDGFADVIVGPGAGGGPHVRVFSGLDGSELMSFMAYDPGFFGGITVASGDVNSDGFADVIVGPGAGGGPHVRVFSGLDGSELMSFMAYDPGFFGGVTVAAGDANGDGFADVIVGPGAGGGPHVRVFSGRDGSELLSFFAFDPGFIGGVRVAAGDVNLDGQVDIFITTGPGTSPIVRVITGSGVELGNFSAFGSAFTGGAFVAGGPMPGETLLLAGGIDGFQNPEASVSQGELTAIITAAIARFEQAGLSNQAIEQLNDVVFRVTDLSGLQLGLSQGNSILIDVNAAGQGWFIDSTPDADGEFAGAGNAIDLAAQGRVDLLTVVLHELGHSLGLPDVHGETDTHELMAPTIATGQRRLPKDSAFDDAFSDSLLLDILLMES